MIIDGICLKTLKHACFNHIECTIDSLVKDTQDEKNIQHRITLKEIKERVDNFIRIGWCERAEGKMNVLIYKA